MTEKHICSWWLASTCHNTASGDCFHWKWPSYMTATRLLPYYVTTRGIKCSSVLLEHLFFFKPTNISQLPAVMVRRFVISDCSCYMEWMRFSGYNIIINLKMHIFKINLGQVKGQKGVEGETINKEVTVLYLYVNLKTGLWYVSPVPYFDSTKKSKLFFWLVQC